MLRIITLFRDIRSLLGFEMQMPDKGKRTISESNYVRSCQYEISYLIG